MQFKFATALAAFMAVTSVTATVTTNVTISSNVVVGTIEGITDISADTNDILMDLSDLNVVAIFTDIPKVILNFKDIVATVLSAITMIGGADPGSIDSTDGQQDICDAFTTFVEVHAELLNTLIGKDSILAGTIFTAPIAAVLRLLEEGVDTLTLGLIGLVPSCADEAKMGKERLDLSLDKAIKAFSIGSS